ncbi:hypothetical protein C8R44DRAFT_728417 [Mycena epipterygia]|nr:hypothetical protein C8R44DRAFT_728417 [Mycena epipterygia]
MYLMPLGLGERFAHASWMGCTRSLTVAICVGKWVTHRGTWVSSITYDNTIPSESNRTRRGINCGRSLDGPNDIARLDLELHHGRHDWVQKPIFPTFMYLLKMVPKPSSTAAETYQTTVDFAFESQMSMHRCPECCHDQCRKTVGFAYRCAWNRHHRLLNSNEGPLDSNTTNVTSVISKARERLVVVEDDLSRLRERVKCLKKHALLSGDLAQNNVILSPLRRMPPKVLGEIFSWTLPTINDFRRKNPGAADSPWILTHISNRWRVVAISTPSLCSLVAINFSHQDHYPLSMVKLA